MEKEITARYTDRCDCDCDNCVECNCDPNVCRCKGHQPPTDKECNGQCNGWQFSNSAKRQKSATVSATVKLS